MKLTKALRKQIAFQAAINSPQSRLKQQKIDRGAAFILSLIARRES